MAEERISPTTIKAVKRGFTMVELIVIVAIFGFLVAIVSPRIYWSEPSKRVLQRSILEAVDTARKGIPTRFRAEKSGNGEGILIPEVYESTGDPKVPGQWVRLKMQYPPAGNAWTSNPEILYFFSDGTCSPGKLAYGTAPEQEKFLLTVTGYLVEEKQF